ncbi:MAG: hypothetical protein IJF08_06115 [Clostridia bacterium]|nr:hypothetical protein [Clostridia bacterium]
MNGEDMFSTTIILIWTLTFGILILIELLPELIRSLVTSIGLARVCNKLQAFPRIWSWVWALFFPPIAIFRAGDAAAKREDENKRRYFKQGVKIIILFVVCCVFAVLCAALAVTATLLSWSSRLVYVSLVAMILLTVPTLVFAVWTIVLLFISYFRILKAFMPIWGAWLAVIGIVVLYKVSFWFLPILSFFPLRKIKTPDDDLPKTVS